MKRWTKAAALALVLLVCLTVPAAASGAVQFYLTGQADSLNQEIKVEMCIRDSCRPSYQGCWCWWSRGWRRWGSPSCRRRPETETWSEQGREQETFSRY